MKQTKQEYEVASLIVTTLNLEIEAGGIDPQAPLFYDGLGLDSIDALEMAMEISRRYAFVLRSDDDNNSEIFATLRSLTDHIFANRAG